MDPSHQQASFREAMSAFPTGVTVVTTTAADGSRCGLTVNSFTSVSLVPPLVLVCIGLESGSHDALLGADAFVVNVLARDQEDVARRFAQDPAEGRFEVGRWDTGAVGAPVLQGCSALVECRRADVLAGGDHSILVGAVERTETFVRPPLVFWRGTFGAVAP